MARKTKKEALETKEAIINSAKKLFYKNGFKNTTLNDIAIDIGQTRGAIYWHFNSKEEIFISIYDEFMYRLDDIIAKTIGKKDANIDSICEYMQKSMYMLVNDYEYRATLDLLLFRTELTPKLQILKDRNNLWTKEMLNIASTIIDKHLESGDFKTNLTSRELAVSIVSMHRGLAFVYTMNNEILPSDNSYEAIIDAFFQNLWEADRDEI